jgi:hypothetical protein
MLKTTLVSKPYVLPFMKYQPRNSAQNQPVFSEKTMAEVRLKLRQFVEIEYLNQAKKKNSRSK